MKKLILSLFVSFFLVLSGPLSAFAQGNFSDDPNGNLAVTPAAYDDIGDVLGKLGFSSTEISEADLTDFEKIKNYDSIYVNCSEGIDSYSADAAAVLQKFVNEGGTLYASDWAGSLINAAFPGKINFYQGKSGYAEDDALGRVGASGIVQAEVVDSGLQDVVGKSSIEVNYDLDYWVIIDSVGSGARVHMQGPANITQISGGEDVTLEDKPYVVSFSEGKGEVLYTTFHNEAQVTSDVEKVLDWFAVRVKAGSLINENRDEGTKGNNLVLKEIVDSIQEEEVKDYTFNATGESDFSVILNFGQSEVLLKVKDPSGKEVLSESVTNAPYDKKIDAERGIYTIEVKGVDTHDGNMPFVLTVSGPENATSEEIEESFSTGRDDGSSFDFEFDLKDENSLPYLIGGTALCCLCLVGIGVALFLLLRRKDKPESIVAATPEVNEKKA